MKMNKCKCLKGHCKCKKKGKKKKCCCCKFWKYFVVLALGCVAVVLIFKAMKFLLKKI